MREFLYKSHIIINFGIVKRKGTYYLSTTRKAYIDRDADIATYALKYLKKSVISSYCFCGPFLELFACFGF